MSTDIKEKPDLSCHGVGEDCSEASTQTFHIGLSVYGPNDEGKFRGAISVDSDPGTVHSEEYPDFATAQTETVAALRSLLDESTKLGKLLRVK